jgi:hypothetical protein
MAYYRDLYAYVGVWADKCAGLNGHLTTRQVTTVTARSREHAMRLLQGRGKRGGSWTLVSVGPAPVQHGPDGEPDVPLQFFGEPLVDEPPVPPEQEAIRKAGSAEIGRRMKAIQSLSGAG